MLYLNNPTWSYSSRSCLHCSNSVVPVGFQFLKTLAKCSYLGIHCPQIIFTSHSAITLKFLMITTSHDYQQLVSQNKTLPRNKQGQSLLSNLFDVLTAKNLTVVGLCNQSKLGKKKEKKTHNVVSEFCQKCPIFIN